MLRRLGLFAMIGTLALAGCGGSGSKPDGDGGPGGVDAPPGYEDEDGDTIADIHEGRDDGTDTDGDGTPDYLDDDSDDDGIPDYREAGDSAVSTPPVDSDNDGTPDFQDTDSDNNGRADGVDGTDDIDGDGIGNYADLDDDGDNIADVFEMGPTPEEPLDTDGDGTPDFQDIDSDDDTIRDVSEGAPDPDLDGLPAYRDTDADGDCRLDADEAGDDDLFTAPIDTDGDGRPDFLDLDSDNDGLRDGDEDANCNGAMDPGESSPLSSDTDSDGASDLVESAAGTDPTNGSDNPQANGDFVFEVPYNEPPTPLEDTLDFSTNISQADVVFSVDTTGSMGGEINNLKTSLVGLVATIRDSVPNVGFGVVDFRDFPTSPYGNGGDWPFLLRHRVMTANTADGLTSVQNAVNLYASGGGNDTPEAGWEALHQLMTGVGTTQGGANVVAFDPGTAPPAVVPAGETIGTLGGVGFRAGSLPIVIWITDACNHNSDAYGYSYDFPASTSNNSIAELMAMSARVIAVISNQVYTGDCGGDQHRLDANNAVVQTGAIVPPSAWGPVGTRPAGCAEGLCCTGLNGDGEATDGSGQCPLLFRIDTAGNGLGNSVAKAVEVLTSYGVLDIGARAADDPSDAVDAVAAFVDRVQANPSATSPCAAGLTAVDTNADGVLDTFSDVTPGTTVCFDVIPKMNTTVEPTEEPQMYRATVAVIGDGVTTLDTRDVYFLVPPEIIEEPID